MRICLITAFPPSGRQLNEYAFHLANELQSNPLIDLRILADELDEYEFATDQSGKPLSLRDQPELPGFNVLRCWEFNRCSNPLRLLRAVKKIQPDVVWFNLVFSTFATQEHPVAAFAGLSAPALIHAFGFYTHVTLHHIIEHVDFGAAGVRQERLFRLGSHLATRTLLRADSVSVLLSQYRRTLIETYGAKNVLLSNHGIFASSPTPPDFSKRGNPHRILAIGHWGTYKRLETLMAAFPAVQKAVPEVRLVIAGANHHTKPGYWESIRDAQRQNPSIDFLGYVPEAEIPELFQTTSIVVLPYDSATGASGPGHQACEYGVPLVCADIDDFRHMAEDEDMDISFYQMGDAGDLANRLIQILNSPEEQHRRSQRNFAAALRMTMPNVIRKHLRWLELASHLRNRNPLAKNSPLPAWQMFPDGPEADDQGIHSANK